MFEAVDIYCERLGPSFWAEPVNALTNVSFLIGALFAFFRAKQLGVMSLAVSILLGLMCAIGLGSFSFHTFANKLTRFLDVLPILLFQLVYLWLYCREIIGVKPLSGMGIIFTYLVAAIFGMQFPHVLNGSLLYAPALAVLFGLGIYHATFRHNERFILMVATLVFVVSLGSRTLDAYVCPYFPFGTHFLWHLLNGIVLYLLIRGFLSNRAMARGQEYGAKLS